jgi:hypothetical protein
MQCGDKLALAQAVGQMGEDSGVLPLPNQVSESAGLQRCDPPHACPLPRKCGAGCTCGMAHVGSQDAQSTQHRMCPCCMCLQMIAAGALIEAGDDESFAEALVRP